MTGKKILFYFLLVIITVPSCAISAFAQKKDAPHNNMPADILRYVNKHRAEKGLQPLIMNNVISGIAEEHSRNMAMKKVPFSHNGMDDRVARAGKELRL